MNSSSALLEIFRRIAIFFLFFSFFFACIVLPTIVSFLPFGRLTVLLDMTSNDLLSFDSRHDEEDELPITTPPDEDNELNRTTTGATKTIKRNHKSYGVSNSFDHSTTETTLLNQDSSSSNKPKHSSTTQSICPVLECVGGSNSIVSQSIVENLLYFQRRGEQPSSLGPDADPVSVTYPHRLSSLQLDFQDLRQKSFVNQHNPRHSSQNPAQASYQAPPFPSQKADKYLDYISRTVFGNPAEDGFNVSQSTTYSNKIPSQGRQKSGEVGGLPHEFDENTTRVIDEADEVINDISSMPVGLRAAGILPLLSLRILDTASAALEKEAGEQSELLESTLTELSISKEEWEKGVREAYVSELPSTASHNLKLSEV